MKKLTVLKKLNREHLKEIQGSADNIRYCCLWFCGFRECASWTTNIKLCPGFEPDECIDKP